MSTKPQKPKASEVDLLVLHVPRMAMDAKLWQELIPQFWEMLGQAPNQYMDAGVLGGEGGSCWSNDDAVAVMKKKAPSNGMSFSHVANGTRGPMHTAFRSDPFRDPVFLYFHWPSRLDCMSWGRAFQWVLDSSLLKSIGYAYGCQMEMKYWPHLFPYGMYGNPNNGAPDEKNALAECRRIAHWHTYLRGPYASYPFISSGMLRDVFPFQVLNASHLEVLIDNTPLARWISQDPIRGSLAESGSGNWIWQIEAVHLPQIRKTFDSQKRILCSSIHTYPGLDIERRDAPSYRPFILDAIKVDKAKRKEILKLLKTLPAQPLLSAPLYFDGNNDEGSIGCNLIPHPGVPKFKEIFESLVTRDDVDAVCIEATESDAEPNEWPHSDTVYVIGRIGLEELKAITQELLPTEVYISEKPEKIIIAAKKYAIPLARPMLAGAHVYGLCWD